MAKKIPTLRELLEEHYDHVVFSTEEYVKLVNHSKKVKRGDTILFYDVQNG